MRACPVSSNYVYVRNQADVIYWRYEHATIGYLVYKSSLGTTLRDLLTKTKTTLPPRLIPTVIYEIYCCDCTVTYNRLTYRPLSIIKRIEEHKGHSRLDLHNPIDFTNTQFGPAHHSRTSEHNIGCDKTVILTIRTTTLYARYLCSRDALGR